MSNKGFNGSTLVFAGTTIGSLMSFDVNKSVPKVGVTASDATLSASVGGIPQITVTAEIMGGTSLDTNATSGTLAVAFFDGTTLGNNTKVFCSKVNTKGSKDNPITTSLEFEPTP